MNPQKTTSSCLPREVRPLFPALGETTESGKPCIYLDGPGGTQVPATVAAAIAETILTASANRGASFITSQRVDRIMTDAGITCSRFLGVDQPERVVFGPNMTSLAFHLADAIIPTLSPGDQIVVSRLDHDANVSPWVHAANRAGATVRFLDFCQRSMTLLPETLGGLIGPKTKFVALTAASNALGSLTPIKELIRAARTTKSLVAVDGTHLAPHILPNVDEWDADFFFCSAYKFFGPHVGIMAAKRNILESLKPAKVRPAPDRLPDKWMTGTQNHEGIAGLDAALKYLATLGDGPKDGLRNELARAYGKIAKHEECLMRVFVERLNHQKSWKLIGIPEPDPLRRVSTFALRGPIPPKLASERLAAKGIFTYAGNFYALPVTEALGVEADGGLLRVGAVHYNTEEEINRLWDELESVSQ